MAELHALLRFALVAGLWAGFFVVFGVLARLAVYLFCLGYQC